MASKATSSRLADGGPAFAPQTTRQAAAVLHARTTYTQQVVASLWQLRFMNDSAATAAAARAAFIEGDGPNLLNLAARIETANNANPYHTPSFLSMFLVRNSDPEMMRALIASVERFGYKFEPEHISAATTALHTLTQQVYQTRPANDELLALQTRLAEVLLEQPSCTREVLLAANKSGSVLGPLLLMKELRLLPLVSILQRRAGLPWDNWLVYYFGPITHNSIEFILQVLLISDEGLQARQGPTSQADEALRMRQSDCNQSPRCSLMRCLYQLTLGLHTNASERAASLNAGSAVSELSSIAALREWIQKMLADLPETLFCARLLCKLSGTDEQTTTGVADLIQALHQQPDSVRLDERNSQGASLISSVLNLSEDYLRSLKPVMEPLLARVAALSPELMQASNPFVITPIHRLCQSHLLTLASEVAPGTSFDRLAGFLFDIATTGEHAANVEAWFSNLTVGAEKSLSWRGVRCGVELLTARGVLVDAKGHSFVWHLVTAWERRKIDPRNWIDQYDGTERSEALESVDRAFRAAHARAVLLQAGTAVSDDITAQVQEWTQVHWPAVRADVEVHLIPDLATITLAFLRLDEGSAQAMVL